MPFDALRARLGLQPITGNDGDRMTTSSLGDRSMNRFCAGLSFVITLALSGVAEAENITATALFETYERNEIVAEDSYNGRSIGIRGRISAIKQAMMGAPIVLLEAGGPNKRVACHLPKKAQAEIAERKIGDQVSFSCRVKYRMGNTIHASACSLN